MMVCSPCYFLSPPDTNIFATLRTALPEAGVSREEMLGAESQNMFDFYDNPNDGGGGDDNGDDDEEDSEEASVGDVRQFVLPVGSVQLAGDEATESERRAVFPGRGQQLRIPIRAGDNTAEELDRNHCALRRRSAGIASRNPSHPGDEMAESARGRFAVQRDSAAVEKRNESSPDNDERTDNVHSPVLANGGEANPLENSKDGSNDEGLERLLRKWGEANNVADMSEILPPELSERRQAFLPQPSTSKDQNAAQAQPPARPSPDDEEDDWDAETVTGDGEESVPKQKSPGAPLLAESSPKGKGFGLATGNDMVERQILDTATLESAGRIPASRPTDHASGAGHKGLPPQGAANETPSVSRAFTEAKPTAAAACGAADEITTKFPKKAPPASLSSAILCGRTNDTEDKSSFGKSNTTNESNIPAKDAAPVPAAASATAPDKPRPTTTRRHIPQSQDPTARPLPTLQPAQQQNLSIGGLILPATASVVRKKKKRRS